MQTYMATGSKERHRRQQKITTVAADADFEVFLYIYFFLKLFRGMTNHLACYKGYNICLIYN